MTKVKHPKLLNPIEKRFDRLSRYHYYIYFLLFVAKIPITWHVLSLIFLSAPMDFHCNVTVKEHGFVNASLGLNFCPCADPKWEKSIFSDTFQTKFGVHCDRAWLTSFSQSIFYVGLLIGAFVFGFLSDRYGRLSMFSIASLVIAVSGCLVVVMPTVASYTFIRCLEGVGCAGAIVTSFVICIEYTGVRYREVVTALYHVPLNIGHISLAGLSYWLRSCDDLQLALSLPMFLVFPIRWLMMESPKWLLDNEKFEDTATVLDRFGRQSVSNDSFEELVEELTTYQKTYSTTRHVKMSFWHIFKHKQVTINLLCMSVIYFVCGIGYYGMTQFIGQMNGNIHINVALSGTIIIPGSIASVFLLQVLSRRTFLISTNFLSGLLTMIVVCIPSEILWLRVFVACLGNSFFFMSFIILFLFGVELFPTAIRSSALGFLTVMSRLGQIAAPPINSLPEIKAGMIFGMMAIIGCILCYPLQETKNIELPSSLEDTKYLKHNVVKLEEESSSKGASTSK